MKKNKNPHDGSTLDELLEEEGILEAVQAAALKRAMALGITAPMEEEALTKPTLRDAGWARERLRCSWPL